MDHYNDLPVMHSYIVHCGIELNIIGFSIDTSCMYMDKTLKGNSTIEIYGEYRLRRFTMKSGLLW